MTSFCSEILQQPAAIRQLVDYYRSQAPHILASIPPPQDLILTGMGASYHAAQVAAYHLQGLGRRALAVEAVDLLQYGSPFLEGCQELVYISQSGSSAEIAPILAQLKGEAIFVAVTNHLDSPLASAAQFALPLAVTEENLVATQTYVNSLAVLWLLARGWAGLAPETGLQALDAIADHVQHLLDRSAAVAARWLEALAPQKTVIFTGFGPHAATARQAAQTVAEWVKLPAIGMGAGALRHGFIETVHPGVGVVIFTAPGRSHPAALRLAADLEACGAAVLLVVNGATRWKEQWLSPPPGVDEFLSPMLDVIPAQLYTEALAGYLGVPPGFRYIQKVITDL